jgi:predicted NBD/HSP70 family sugar kinase
MAYFAGLDVSVKETRVCIVDDAGKIVREARVASERETSRSGGANRRRQCGSRRSCSRSLLRWTLPVAVRGRSWAISNRRGRL